MIGAGLRVRRGVGGFSCVLRPSRSGARQYKMRLVPVHVYDDVLWASFKDRFEKLGSVLNIGESEPHLKNLFSVAQLRAKEAVRITVFCSAIVIDVIVHCHTAGALLSQTAENISCGWVLILSGQSKITLVAELGIQPIVTFVLDRDVGHHV